MKFTVEFLVDLVVSLCRCAASGCCQYVHLKRTMPGGMAMELSMTFNDLVHHHNRQERVALLKVACSKFDIVELDRSTP